MRYRRSLGWRGAMSIPPFPQSLTGSISIERTNPKIRVEEGDIESVVVGPLEGNELEEAFASAIDNVVWK